MERRTHKELSASRLKNLREVERTPLYGLLDNIRSLYNVGSIFRTSDGGFIRGLYLCGYTPVPPRKEIEKTALGATRTIPWKFFKNPLDALHDARALGARICVLELTTRSRPYYEIRREDFPLCLVVGNEIAGVSGSILQEADMALEIPMYGAKQSLNAAVAYGIALFHLVRVWKQG